MFHGCPRTLTLARRLMFMTVLLYATVPLARGEQYWVAWEGDDFPENEGWTRIVNGPQPAERTLADGIMTMDGLADRQIDDYYRMERPLDPGPGETFVMQWRLRVDEVIGHPFSLFDAGLGLFSDDDWSLTLVFGVDFIQSLHEQAQIPFDPGAFHVFEVRSQDMRSYTLRVDGAIARNGTFWEPTFTSSRLEWGDYSRGSATLVDWDHFRFGVIPEPPTLAIMTVSFCACAPMRRAR